ncbi:MAG: FkbM family methyltransferase [Xenococcaceae cyanobacterium MO_207.B15]|nr:FkbM family methyltransferase [Xenococcaceae cyanobacterium MO_207.B15]
MFDIGAHRGYFTLNASRIVGNDGQVFAFEPLPRNISLLKKHLQFNNCTNVRLFEVAVSSKSGQKGFISRNSFVGHLSQKGELKVEVIALDEFVKLDLFVTFLQGFKSKYLYNQKEG